MAPFALRLVSAGRRLDPFRDPQLLESQKQRADKRAQIDLDPGLAELTQEPLLIGRVRDMPTPFSSELCPPEIALRHRLDHQLPPLPEQIEIDRESGRRDAVDVDTRSHRGT